MKQPVFITARDARHGFGIAGARQYAIHAEELRATLQRVMDDPASGVIVVDERLLPGIDPEHFRELEQRWYGILLVLPASENVVPEEEDYAMQLVRKAIGYHVRISG